MKIWGWPADEQGCGYYRIRVPFAGLAALGHVVAAHRNLSERAKREVDILVGQRVYLPGPSSVWQGIVRKSSGTGLLRGRRIKLVYEIDDNLFGTDPSSPAHQLFGRRDVRAAMAANMTVADLVTVTTPHLAEIAMQFNHNVAVLPNYIDEKMLAIQVPPEDDRLVVGWGGSSTHAMDWVRAAPGMQKVMRARRNQHVTMRFLGTTYADGLPAARVETLGWTDDLFTHYRNVASFNIGLAPLATHAFNNSKSGIKAIEYAALGVPCIASDEPPYRGVVEHGVTGFLVRKREDWARYLDMLISDERLRKEMGEAARERAKEWTIQANAWQWEQAYQQLLGGHA